MTDWKLGQYVRIWKNEGYEYGHIETIEGDLDPIVLWDGTVHNYNPVESDQVMLVGDDGKEIYTTVKQLEDAE